MSVKQIAVMTLIMMAEVAIVFGAAVWALGAQ